MLRPVSLNLGLWAADLERIMALSCQQDKCTQATEVNIAQQAERALCHGSSILAERGRQENLSWEAGGGGGGPAFLPSCIVTFINGDGERESAGS